MLNPLAESRTDTGFSLIEALVAAAHFAIITLGIMPVFIRSTQDTARNRNYLHFNGGLQAIMDELTVKALGTSTGTTGCNAAGPMLNAGWHVYSNTYDWTLPANCAANDPTVPKAVVDLFRGTGATVTTDKTMQNKLLGQVQYRIGTEYGRTRADIRIHYFKSANFVVPMTSICPAECDTTFPALGATPVAPPQSPAHMAVISGSGYIDLP